MSGGEAVTTNSPKTAFAFADFRLDPNQRTLIRDGRLLALTPKEFDTLLALVRAGGRVVSKEDLIEQVWPDSYVGEGSLARNISVLRRSLGDELITTVPRYGYRLSTPVRELALVEPAAPAVSPEGRKPVVAVSEAPSQPPSRRGHRYWLLYAALVLSLGAIAMVLSRDWEIGKAKRSIASWRVAVLPFANYTGDVRNEYVCDGITEAMISELSRLDPRKLAVIARTSAMKFKNSGKSVPEIARELKADYILEGSVRTSGARWHITTQLVRGSDASHVWTGEYDRTLQDTLDLQEEISLAVAQEIHLSLDASAGERLRGSHQQVDAEAYNDYLLGRFYWGKRNTEGLFKSVGYFQRAISRDPNYAQAYAGLADAYLVLGAGFMPDIEAYEKARAAAEKALDLDKGLADAYTSLAYEKFVNELDMKGAEERYRRALSLDPNSANAHHWYALYLMGMKRLEEAIVHINRAAELDPLAIAIRYNAATIYMVAGRYNEAAREARRGIEIDPESPNPHRTLGLVYQRQGLYEQALAEFKAAQDPRGCYSPLAVEMAQIYTLQGKKDQAHSVLTSLLSASQRCAVSPKCLAAAYAALDQKDKAFYWLRRCVDDRSCTALEINYDRGLDPLRSDPRFSRITQPYR
jgi:TolB-like protein/DNA-binding winged helix-turn-helix (wHTH) protein/Tfp pilus assembly protein PilF